LPLGHFLLQSWGLLKEIIFMDDDKTNFLEFLKMLKEANDARSPYLNMARTIKHTYDAFLEAGFNEEQAFELVLAILNSAASSMMKG
jgi:hypothetical protein